MKVGQLDVHNGRFVGYSDEITLVKSGMVYVSPSKSNSEACDAWADCSSVAAALVDVVENCDAEEKSMLRKRMRKQHSALSKGCGWSPKCAWTKSKHS